METGTQTEHLMTIPLEVLAVSCITYNMIDKIRDVLQQAERDLWSLLFGNSIPESVLGGPPPSCNPSPGCNPPPSCNPPPTSPPPTSPLTTPCYEPNVSDPPISPAVCGQSDMKNTSTELDNKSGKLLGSQSVGISALRGLTESNVGQLPARSSLKRKPGHVTSPAMVTSRDMMTSLDMMTSRETSRERGRNGKSGKRVKHLNGKKEDFSDLLTVKIKEEPQPAPEPSPLLDKQYHCEQCRAEFSCFERLSRHVTMVHSSRTTETVSQPAVPNLHQCVVCNQTFSNSTVLREHQLRHHRHSAILGAGLICNICGKCSTDKTSFEEHKRKHTVNKNFRCHVCYKGFSQNDNLLQHLRVIHNVKDRKSFN